MCHHGCSCYGSLDAQPDEVFWHRCCSDAIIVDAEGCRFTGAKDDSLSMKAASPNSILQIQRRGQSPEFLGNFPGFGVKQAQS